MLRASSAAAISFKRRLERQRTAWSRKRTPLASSSRIAAAMPSSSSSSLIEPAQIGQLRALAAFGGEIERQHAFGRAHVAARRR